VEEGGPIVAAVGMLDGTVALVSTGIAHPTPRRHDPATKQQQRGPAVPDIGTLLSSSCARGSAIALSLCFRPTGGGGSSVDLAVGRQDGVVDLVTTTTAGLSSNASAKNHHHRLIRHTSPVRAASYTPDGHLLITGSDEGLVCVWDASRGGVGGGPRQQAGVALVHHLQLNSRSWILNIVPLDDSRRFAVCSQDGTLSIWDLEHPGQVSHTFVAAPSASSSPSSSTTAPHPSTTANPPALTACCSVEGRHRLVAGNDAGYLQLFSIE
jgi:WD40 repeat protein